MSYALVNGVIYTAEAVLYGQAVVVEGDKIVAIVPQENVPSELEQIDLQGHNLTAGFIDLQLNGCGGVMFNGETSVKTLEIMQETNLRSGTTSYLPTFITADDEGMKKAVVVMREYLKTHQNQALGLHLEGPYLSVEKKGVHQVEYIRAISEEMKDFLCQNAEVISKITLAPENPTAQYVAEFVAKGIVVSIGHSNATYEIAKQAIENGASFATHLHNAMSPISSGREMGVVGAVLESDIYAGIIVDGLHVEFDNIKIDKKAKGDKLCIVTDATAAAGAEIDSFDFVGKTVYVRNGKCYDANGTLGGSAITMIESVENAVKHVGIPLDETLRMCNYYPAKAIGVTDRLGDISEGKIANLTLFNAQFEVLATAVNGQWKWHKN
ncbi:N-acetylglucosamine-6-phosphate deacetylase [Avibacterium paragallinarum]|uniref:N-acetylglucosamine-6-phosphate deacetylase n=1 Tax=Avibacterium paragallinarum TaxID=728 RepID=A0A377IAQ6_AVIPA|nr:N-acetylglucosamine-6-phosphate deacetylase [Avibacterium paragallinarum]POY46933.1 N-acetylglucosamine-6-phosphate deacetylase [Avibacterium paragallinarum]RZN77527.1 N-acetylglucosamine-6-phosphate deacetylase [Avibacterium paragallinarum]TID18642.1 N-acetylglucosamine-6-phosphate deacetylase [Avibacterium paragallinarum]CDG00063.1 Putative N-acetylglucosamine-6-phosphate deacetylase [Avibacterium paragallinarum JF4211]STO72458.1 N-acetylglucosamine-6-phosphate deacetylase [Avibacterium p